MPHNESVVFFNNLNQGCVAGQTQESNAPMWNVGSYVWTLFDVSSLAAERCCAHADLVCPFFLFCVTWQYYGEPGHWPHISSSFGSFDLAGACSKVEALRAEANGSRFCSGCGGW
jgi:hypothetical protein